MEAAGRLVVKVKSLEDERILWGIGDTHLMNVACLEKKLDENIARIADDPHSLWVGLGDLADLISFQDKRYDPVVTTEGSFRAKIERLGPRAVELIAEKFWPIARKCFGLGVGNHEHKFEVRFEQSIIEEVLARWNARLGAGRGAPWRVPFLGYCSLRDLVFVKGKRSQRFRICTHHGARYAQTKGGKLNRLLKFMADFDADIYMMGHVHTVTDDTIVRIGANDACDHLTHTTRMGVICGTYLKTYTQGVTTYGEIAMYEPTVLGSPRITIVPRTRELGVVKPG